MRGLGWLTWAVSASSRRVVQATKERYGRVHDRTASRVAAIRKDRQAPRYQRVPVEFTIWLLSLARVAVRGSRPALRWARRGVQWAYVEGQERAREFAELRDVDRRREAERARARAEGEEVEASPVWQALCEEATAMRRRIMMHRVARGTSYRRVGAVRPCLVEGELQFGKDPADPVGSVGCACAGSRVIDGSACPWCEQRERVLEDWTRRDNRSAREWRAARRQVRREAATEMCVARRAGDTVAWRAASDRYIRTQYPDWGTEPRSAMAVTPDSAVVVLPSGDVEDGSRAEDLVRLVPLPVHSRAGDSSGVVQSSLSGGGSMTGSVDGEVLHIDQARGVLTQILIIGENLGASLEMLSASLMQVHMDSVTMSDVMDLEECVGELVDRATRVRDGIDQRHSRLEEAVRETPDRADLDFYESA